MKYTISQFSSTPNDPWEDFERQRKYDNSLDEEYEIEEDCDDVEEDSYEDEEE